MGSRVLEIIATLEDQISDKIDAMDSGLGKLESSLMRNGHQAIMFGRAMDQAGRFLVITGALLTGPLALAFNASAKYSESVSIQIQRLKDTTTAFQVSLATAMVPVVTQFNNVLSSLVASWLKLPSPMRDSIVQAALLTGAYLVLSGTVLIVVGNLIKFIGEMERIAALSLKFAAANAAVILSTIAWVAAIAVLIVFWDQLKGIAVPVLNSIQIAVDMVAIGFQKMLQFATYGFIGLLNALHDTFMALGSIEGPQQKVFLGMAQGLQTASGALHNFYTAQQQTIQDLTNDISNILTTGKSSLSTNVDALIAKVKQLSQAIQNAFKNGGNLNVPTQYFDAILQFVKQTAAGMTNALTTGFFDVMTGKFNDLKNVAIDWGNQILKTIANIIAKMILVNTIGQISLGGGIGKLAQYFHSGGMIQKAHDGMLAYDEVPIIAQSGEAVLSRTGVQTLGTANVSSLNAGKGLSGGGQAPQINVNPTIVVQAMDSSDVLRNAKNIAAAVCQEIVTNGSMRNILKQFT